MMLFKEYMRKFVVFDIANVLFSSIFIIGSTIIGNPEAFKDSKLKDCMSLKAIALRVPLTFLEINIKPIPFSGVFITSNLYQIAWLNNLY